MSKDIKLSKAQLSKLIQSGRFLRKTLGNVIGNLGKKALIELAVPLAKNGLSKLVTKATSVLDKFERKISGKGAVRAGKGFTLFISNKDMVDIINIVESLEKSGLLIDVATETVKHEIKKECDLFSYGFFIDTTCYFFIDKCYIWKRSHESSKRTRKLVSSHTFIV